jgi:hypothetical protein
MRSTLLGGNFTELYALSADLTAACAIATQKPCEPVPLAGQSTLELLSNQMPNWRRVQ